MLQFRAMQDSDLGTMTQIVEHVWDMDTLCGGKKAGRFMSREYLWKTLGHSTGVQVAVWDGEVAGFLAYRETTSPYLLLPNMASEEEQPGMEILSMRRRMEEYDGLCTALLKKSGYIHLTGRLHCLQLRPNGKEEELVRLYLIVLGHISTAVLFSSIRILAAIISFMIRMVCAVLHNKHMRTLTRKIGLFGSFSMVYMKPLFHKM